MMLEGGRLVLESVQNEIADCSVAAILLWLKIKRGEAKLFKQDETLIKLQKRAALTKQNRWILELKEEASETIEK